MHFRHIEFEITTGYVRSVADTENRLRGPWGSAGSSGVSPTSLGLSGAVVSRIPSLTAPRPE